MTAVKSYQKKTEVVDKQTGEVTTVITSNIKYLEGRPRQYRFDGKAGKFNINGEEVLGAEFSFQPIAWRIFSDDILGMGVKTWAELFFIDDKNCVSVILFHSYSVDNLYKLIEPLFYAELTLSDVIITARAEKKENTKITPKATYYMLEFSFKVADQVKTQQLKDFVADHRIYRAETVTDTATVKLSQSFYTHNSLNTNLTEASKTKLPEKIHSQVNELV